MIDKIQAFGDSFLFGSDLKDSDNRMKFSHKTWAALIADRLGLDYECWAMGGVGNQYIASTVIDHATTDSLSVINWTWIDRFDYHTIDNDPETLRPAEDTELESFYYRHLHSEISDKLRDLMMIHSTISWLREHDMPFVMTAMDKLMFDQRWNINPAIKNIQNNIRKDITWFSEEQTFLEWSRSNGYPESDLWHPLEQAHEEASKIMLPTIKKAINTHIT